MPTVTITRRERGSTPQITRHENATVSEAAKRAAIAEQDFIEEFIIVTARPPRRDGQRLLRRFSSPSGRVDLAIEIDYRQPTQSEEAA